MKLERNSFPFNHRCSTFQTTGLSPVNSVVVTAHNVMDRCIVRLNQRGSTGPQKVTPRPLLLLGKDRYLVNSHKGNSCVLKFGIPSFGEVVSHLIFTPGKIPKR